MCLRIECKTSENAILNYALSHLSIGTQVCNDLAAAKSVPLNQIKPQQNVNMFTHYCCICDGVGAVIGNDQVEVGGQLWSSILKAHI